MCSILKCVSAVNICVAVFNIYWDFCLIFHTWSYLIFCSYVWLLKEKSVRSKNWKLSAERVILAKQQHNKKPKNFMLFLSFLVCSTMYREKAEEELNENRKNGDSQNINIFIKLRFHQLSYRKRSNSSSSP